VCIMVFLLLLFETAIIRGLTGATTQPLGRALVHGRLRSGPCPLQREKRKVHPLEKTSSCESRFFPLRRAAAAVGSRESGRLMSRP